MRKTSCCVAVLLALVSSCRDRAPPAPEPEAVAKPAPPPDPLAWTTYSSDRTAFAEQRRLDENRCQVSCVRSDGKTAWILGSCIATRDDLRFLAPDCAAVLVLRPYPAVEDSWAQTVVMVAWGGNGLINEARAMQLVPGGGGYQVSGTHLRWLQGVYGERGTAPRYSEDGLSLELEVLDGTSRRVPLTQAQPEAPAAGPDDSGDAPGLYRYLDDDGELHVVEGLSNVPTKHRRRAQPVGDDGISFIRAADGTPPPPLPAKPRPQPTWPSGPTAPWPPRPAAPQPRPVPEDGVERNVFGESTLEYMERTRLGLPPPPAPGSPEAQPRRLPPLPKGAIPSCFDSGAACDRHIDCCGGRCTNRRCE